MLCSFAGADFCSGKAKREENTVVLSRALTQHGRKSARQNRYVFDSRQLKLTRIEPISPVSLPEGELDLEEQREIHRKGRGRDRAGAACRVRPWPQLCGNGAFAAGHTARARRTRRENTARPRPERALPEGRDKPRKRHRRAGSSDAGTHKARMAGDRKGRIGRRALRPQLYRHGASAAGHTAAARLRRRACAGRGRAERKRYLHRHRCRVRNRLLQAAQSAASAAEGDGQAQRNAHSRPVQPRPHDACRLGKLRPRHRPRRGDTPQRSDPLAPQQE